MQLGLPASHRSVILCFRRQAGLSVLFQCPILAIGLRSNGLLTCVVYIFRRSEDDLPQHAAHSELDVSDDGIGGENADEAFFRRA